MQEEFTTLVKNHTWSLVPLTSVMNEVWHKLLFRIKCNIKARLMAKGF